jgi:2-polyprenyl-3-methyl-5-hydroxy-6-metoxy-1,4-benzoquinol methylase
MSGQSENPNPNMSEAERLYAIFAEAERLSALGDLEGAATRYLELTKDAAFAPLAFFQLAQAVNRAGDPLAAKDCFYQAFSMKPNIAKLVLPKEHPNHNYIFPGKKDEKAFDRCPLCGAEGRPYLCYSTIFLTSTNIQSYNPVRLWMICDACSHLFAGEFPEPQPETHSQSDPENPILGAVPTNPGLFPYYSNILSRLAKFAKGTELLEIGLGGSDCLLAAREMGFNTFGIDIVEPNVMQARQYGLDAERHDFMKFNPNRKWDIIIMGDVLEHVSDPVAALQKTCCLLNDSGALWISTPNFYSAYGAISGHNDAMRIVATHKNYFSRNSLYKLLDRIHLFPMEYRISSHFNGSMEVICKKAGRAE